MTLQYFARSTNLLYQAASRHPFILYFVNDKERVFYILVQAPCALQVLRAFAALSSVTLTGLTLRVQVLLPSNNVTPCLTRKFSRVSQETGNDGKLLMLTLCDGTIPILPRKK